MRLMLFGPRIFGLRTGISFGRQDLAKLFNGNAPISASATFDPDHSFIYVIKNESGRVKVGRAANCNQRLADLQTGNPERLSFAWIGAPRGDACAIEIEAHAILENYRLASEWFAVTPDAAVGAVCAAAQRRGQPVLGLTAEDAEKIRLAAIVEAAQQSPQKVPYLYRHPYKFILGLTAVLWISFMIWYFIQEAGTDDCDHVTTWTQSCKDAGHPYPTRI